MVSWSKAEYRRCSIAITPSGGSTAEMSVKPTISGSRQKRGREKGLGVTNGGALIDQDFPFNQSTGHCNQSVGVNMAQRTAEEDGNALVVLRLHFLAGRQGLLRPGRENTGMRVRSGRSLGGKLQPRVNL